MKKNLILILIALALMILFPALPQALAAVVAAGAVWLSTQPLLLVFGLGLLARPHLGRTKTAPAGH